MVAQSLGVETNTKRSARVLDKLVCRSQYKKKRQSARPACLGMQAKAIAQCVENELLEAGMQEILEGSGMGC